MTQATPLRSQSIPVTDPEAGLRMTEIFYSLQGEALTSGLPTVFVRLTGCHSGCNYIGRN
jgi:7-carboxy-7-deazaguanine synthase